MIGVSVRSNRLRLKFLNVHAASLFVILRFKNVLENINRLMLRANFLQLRLHYFIVDGREKGKTGNVNRFFSISSQSILYLSFVLPFSEHRVNVHRVYVYILHIYVIVNG